MRVEVRSVLQAAICGLPFFPTASWAKTVSYSVAAGATVNWQQVHWASGTIAAPSTFALPQPTDTATISGSATATMRLDGTATVTSLWVSASSAAKGVTLELGSSANLTTTADSSLGKSSDGWGVVNINGGTWTVAGAKRLDIGQSFASGGTSTLNMLKYGGTLNTSTLCVGRFGAGTLNQDSGLISATTTVLLGGANGLYTVSHYNLSHTGTLQTAQLQFTYANADASEAWNMTGGTLKTAKILYDSGYNANTALFQHDDGTLAPISITGTSFSDIGTTTFQNSPGRTAGYSMGPNAHLALQLASSSSFDKLVMGGDFTAGGTLDVTLAGYVPNVGDTFALFTAAGYHGGFAQINLPAGVAWDTSRLLIDGTLSVSDIPEPTAGTLLSIGGLGALRRLRRSRQG